MKRENSKQFERLVTGIDKILKAKSHVIVAVSGFGGSGKTTVAEKIKNHFPDSTCIQLDNFLINRGRGEGWAGGYDWQRFEQVLTDVQAGKDLHYKFYDWHKDALSDGYIDQKLPSLVIVEGVRILQPDLRAYYDLSIWIDVDLDTATKRGQARDRQNWQDKSDRHGLEAHLNTWHKTWAAKDKEFYEKFHPDQLADVIYNPGS